MADSVQSFEFKPALIRGRNNWTLDGGFLTRNGELFSSLDTIIGARFAEMSARGTRSAWLDLEFKGGRHRITCNMPPGDSNHTAFLQLCAAIMEGLETRRPDMQVKLGAGGAVRWAMFLIGAFAALFGLGMVLLGLDGAAGDRSLFAVLFGGFFGLVGGGLAWGFRPWAPPQTLTPGQVRTLFAARLAVNAEPGEAQGSGEEPEQDKGQGASG